MFPPEFYSDNVFHGYETCTKNSKKMDFLKSSRHFIEKTFGENECSLDECLALISMGNFTNKDLYQIAFLKFRTI